MKSSECHIMKLINNNWIIRYAIKSEEAINTLKRENIWTFDARI